jgi:hypothetical protein
MLHSTYECSGPSLSHPFTFKAVVTTNSTSHAYVKISLSDNKLRLDDGVRCQYQQAAQGTSPLRQRSSYLCISVGISLYLSKGGREGLVVG